MYLNIIQAFLSIKLKQKLCTSNGQRTQRKNTDTKHAGGERESVCVPVCVCVSKKRRMERERERESARERGKSRDVKTIKMNWLKSCHQQDRYNNFQECSSFSRQQRKVLTTIGFHFIIPFHNPIISSNCKAEAYEKAHVFRAQVHCNYQNTEPFRGMHI